MKHNTKMTKSQHLIGLLIMLPSLPFALPLSILVFVTKWLAIGAEELYDFVGRPFIWANRQWAIYCEKLNKVK